MDSAAPVAMLKRRLDALESEQPQGFIRLSTPCQVDHLMGWMDGQRALPRLYWKAREADAPEYAMVGVVKAFDSLAALHQDQDALAACSSEQPDYFGGMAFDPDAEGWTGFGACHFLLPRLALKRDGQNSVLSLNLRFDDRPREQELADARAALEALNPPRPLPPMKPLSLMREDTPSRDEWVAQVHRVTQPEQLRRTPKVVLSRETCLHSAEMPSPWALLSHWQARAADCFQFGIQLTPYEAFIGCPPERLYQREGTHLVSEALAGTTPRGRTAQQDGERAAALLSDAKNGLENQCVYQQLLSQLEPLSCRIDMGEAHIVTLRSVLHIRRLIHAKLHPGVSDQALLDTLPPTPAVGGVPRQAALAFIRQHERQRRGWYAGVFGRISHASSDLAVAIRCAQVGKDTIRLYAGAGIVKGSEPDAEWRELDSKIADIMALLGMG
ncbi:isochorismate synthase [Halomonas aquamarina]|uniref:Isochorismate synthase n=2 Tax=Vreelandella aquamarina TaxID=77097 RepID=A0ACC5VW19_9GAMM|nr:isochorismate synthase [Halomonas aquamarina]